jgi:phosphatidylglycerol---prolipoprotein diacylglyceryl transferase
MIYSPDIDPVALAIGPLKVHWYGLGYLGAFLMALWLGKRRARRGFFEIQETQIEDFVFYAAIGIMLGGRIGYVLFYHFGYFLENPLWLFKINEGGMSWHGGAIGFLIGIFLYSRKIGANYGSLMDLAVSTSPFGIGLVRVANFVNQELWGRATDAPWGMIFTRDPLQIARHPSQLYEAFLEGLVLFFVTQYLCRTKQPPYRISGIFMILYGIFRFGVEFFREPDHHIGLEWFGWMTRGQELTVPVIMLGIFLYALSCRQAKAV